MMKATMDQAKTTKEKTVDFTKDPSILGGV